MAHRRVLDKSDESALSTTSLVRNVEVVERFLSATELEVLTGSEILGQSLSLHSVISTVSSFSLRFQRARSRPELQDVNEIGSGLQGVVFEQVGEACVFKKENTGNQYRTTSLRNEYPLHQAAWTTFERYRTITNTKIQVPEPLEFLPNTPNSAFWLSVLPKMPAEYRAPGDILRMQRILPLPKIVRRGLVAHLCAQERYIETPETTRILDNPQNKHCLARIYLGKHTGPYDTHAPLRNFPLYLDTMKRIGLDITSLATELGIAYAILHWGAGINGDDVEFVFGTSALGPTENSANPGFQHRAIGAFLLDFGQCEMVDLNEEPENVYQSFKGAMVTGDNQSFIPHYATDPELFNAFKMSYIETGKKLLSEKQLSNVFSIEDFFGEYEEYAEDFLA